MVVFGSPREKFSDTELQSVKKFINKGGSLFFLSNEGGDTKQGTNGNDLLQEYGITIKANCLISTVQEHYLHPKEVLVSDSVLCNELTQFSRSEIDATDFASWDSSSLHRKGSGSLNFQDSLTSSDENFKIVYPYGATLTLQKPAAAILSSGLMAHPVRQPIGAIWQGGKENGKVAVIGSVAIFEDSWIEKESNAKLFDFLILWLLARIPIKTDKINMEELESAELEYAPNIGALANRLRCCLQEADELPRDFTRLTDDSLFTYNTNLVPEVVNLYKCLGVKPGPLTLIAPEFETPTLPLLPAILPPSLREPPPPPLDLFDLDDCFASPFVHLARLTNKCKAADCEDLLFYILESTSTIGIKPEAIGIHNGSHTDNAKAILSFMVKEIVDMKKLKTENTLALTPAFCE